MVNSSYSVLSNYPERTEYEEFQPPKTYTHDILFGTVYEKIRLIGAQALVFTLGVPQNRRNES